MTMLERVSKNRPSSERGFQRRIGFGKRPALINVDLANAWTRPGNPFTCEKIDDEIIPGVQRLMKVFRANHFPIVHVTTCYQNTDRHDPNTDMGQWHNKIPVDVVTRPMRTSGDRLAHRASRWRVRAGEEARQFSSAALSRYLRSAGVDTILVTGVTASACVPPCATARAKASAPSP